MIAGVPNLESRNAYLEMPQRLGLVIYVVITMLLRAAYKRPLAVTMCSGTAWVAMYVAGALGRLIWMWTIPSVGMVASTIIVVCYGLLRCDRFGRMVGPIIASFGAS